MNQKQTYMIIGGSMLAAALAMLVVFNSWLLAMILTLAGAAFLISSVTQKPKVEQRR